MRQIRAELRKALTEICHDALADQRITAALPDGHELDPLDLLSGLIKSHAWTAKAKNTITISSEEIDMLLQKLSSPRRIKRAAARVDAFFELCEWSGQADLMAGIAVKSPYPALSDPERLHLKFTEDERLGILCRHVCIESGHSFSKTRLTEHGKEARKRYEKIGADLRKAEAEAVAAKRPSSRSRKAAQEKEDGKALSAAARTVRSASRAAAREKEEKIAQAAKTNPSKRAREPSPPARDSPSPPDSPGAAPERSASCTAKEEKGARASGVAGAAGAPSPCPSQGKVISRGTTTPAASAEAGAGGAEGEASADEENDKTDQEVAALLGDSEPEEEEEDHGVDGFRPSPQARFLPVPEDDADSDDSDSSDEAKAKYRPLVKKRRQQAAAAPEPAPATFNVPLRGSKKYTNSADDSQVNELKALRAQLALIEETKNAAAAQAAPQARRLTKQEEGKLMRGLCRRASVSSSSSSGIIDALLSLPGSPCLPHADNPWHKLTRKEQAAAMLIEGWHNGEEDWNRDVADWGTATGTIPDLFGNTNMRYCDKNGQKGLRGLHITEACFECLSKNGVIANNARLWTHLTAVAKAAARALGFNTRSPKTQQWDWLDGLGLAKQWAGFEIISRKWQELFKEEQAAASILDWDKNSWNTLRRCVKAASAQRALEQAELQAARARDEPNSDSDRDEDCPDSPQKKPAPSKGSKERNHKRSKTSDSDSESATEAATAQDSDESYREAKGKNVKARKQAKLDEAGAGRAALSRPTKGKAEPQPEMETEARRDHRTRPAASTESDSDAEIDRMEPMAKHNDIVKAEKKDKDKDKHEKKKKKSRGESKSPAGASRGGGGSEPGCAPSSPSASARSSTGFSTTSSTKEDQRTAALFVDICNDKAALGFKLCPLILQHVDKALLGEHLSNNTERAGSLLAHFFRSTNRPHGLAGRIPWKNLFRANTLWDIRGWLAVAEAWLTGAQDQGLVFNSSTGAVSTRPSTAKLDTKRFTRVSQFAIAMLCRQRAMLNCAVQDCEGFVPKVQTGALLDYTLYMILQADKYKLDGMVRIDTQLMSERSYGEFDFTDIKRLRECFDQFADDKLQAVRMHCSFCEGTGHTFDTCRARTQPHELAAVTSLTDEAPPVCRAYNIDTCKEGKNCTQRHACYYCNMNGHGVKACQNMLSSRASGHHRRGERDDRDRDQGRGGHGRQGRGRGSGRGAHRGGGRGSRGRS